ncbi:hypothetical protein COCSUDRAFT_45640 [Coccomyxa subellipsoidea C-169]|uniref:Methyltransferase domain-containing protein n=1 Tax=Coccomyxa subellipsoidea (strain C-169) TaxID=574566 RepID=I0YI79_COCSC|nr:hypothetical protein COCSUDRAFT_45640 [Coccomyxa subellipsoidea C-169]EIE18098.1 hypothetical protein COCSUDRAFT_45640 [Coccomyxa subellipsoidea C-169]|eukprot:XP_005642642.1 hypothetical protein COCSUDRAFT_45640 [Coccomyxa subellipsoidea C-169]
MNLLLTLVHLVLASGALGLNVELSSHQDQSHSKTAQTENIFLEARDKANRERKALPGTVLTSAVTDLGDFRRIWDFYTPDYNCPFLKERVGRLGDGGKWVCGLRYLLQSRSCLIYSLGSAGDASFEEQLLSQTPCEVHTFDPNLSAETQTQMQASLPSLNFHAVGLGRSSGPLKSPSDRGMHSFQEVMAALGHSWVDVLKMDIEGHEWDVFLDFYAQPDARLPATQLLVEFHWPGSADKVWKVLDVLLADKYRIFSVEPNYYCEDGACAKNLLEFSFNRVSDNGHVCAPHSHTSSAEEGAGMTLPHGC